MLAMVGVVVLILVLVASGVVVASRPATRGAPVAGPTTAGPSHLAVLQVRGGLAPLAAVIGSEGTPPAGAMTLPGSMTITVPGQGSAEVHEAAKASGRTFRIAASNTVGAWAQDYGVMDRPHLAAVVDRLGGIRVTVPTAFDAGNHSVGPGSVLLTGRQVETYLGIRQSPQLDLRWQLVLGGLLARRVQLLPSDFIEANQPLEVAGVVEAAQGAGIDILPTKNFGGDPKDPLVEVDRTALPRFMGQVFGYPNESVPVIVINGAGYPSVGESVAARVIPAGFHLVFSENARRFGRKRTAIVAAGKENVTAAERVRAALGVGQVQVSDISSGLAQVTILVGRNYK
jgi:LytR cell envelope-related transcriptional attenuator/LytR_cpsA_psr family